MKRQSILVLVVFGINTIMVSSCHYSRTENSKKDYPGEWMFNQRAYPNKQLDPKVVSRGILETKQALQNKTRSEGSWELLGPINVGGRVTDVAISPDNDDHIYIATAVGGVFKSTDRGGSWIPIFDDQGKLSIGNIAIAPSNSSRIYVGTGEANGSATSGAFFGDGVYRSDNGGNSWTHIGLTDTQHVGRIVVDSSNEDRVFVATTGVLYGKNEERGLYRSTDAGGSWDKVLYVSDSTAVIDVAINPVNSNILFASTWERIRHPWQRTYGGITSGVYRSLDGGDSWAKLENGLPLSNTETGRIGLAISDSNPNTIYASYTTNSITNTFDGLYKSTDNGDNWALVSSAAISDVNSSFGWYFGNVRVNPENPNDVMVLGQKLYRTTNGGVDWTSIYEMHVDHHSMEFSKNNTNFIVSGNDGGVYLSENGGATWTHITNLPITQFYNIEVDYSNPNRIFGGAQDNNTLRTETGSADDWHSILGGDGFQVNVDKNDGSRVYAEYQWGNLFRSEDGGDTFYYTYLGLGDDDRTNWNTPVEISPYNTNVLYYGSNKVYRSNDYANTWTNISGDLTDGLHPSGSTAYGTLSAIAPSYLNLNVVYVGSDDGNVSATFDGGTTWNSIDDDLPNRSVSQIIVHPTNDLIAYVTFSGYEELDYSSHVYKTIDGGVNWLNISGNLPNVPVNDILISESSLVLFIATDTSVWYSENQGVSWQIVGDNLPMTVVADIKIHELTQTLYAGMFGRSIYSFDLNQLAIGVTDTSVEMELLSVFSNPAKHNLTVRINHVLEEKASIKLMNQQGKLIKELFTGSFPSGTQEFTFDISNLSPGVYFVHVNSAQPQVRKLIVE